MRSEILTGGVCSGAWEGGKARCSEAVLTLGLSAALGHSASTQECFLFHLLFLIALVSENRFIMKLSRYWKTTQSYKVFAELSKCLFPKQSLHHKYCEARRPCSDRNSSIIEKETKLK